MKYRKIANTDLEVSSVALGTWVFGGQVWGEVEDPISIRVIEEAIDKGINLIDTAPTYGEGRSEEVLGRAIKGKRDRVVIATKFGLEKKGSVYTRNLSASFIRRQLEESLRNLGVEAIDLYQCHWPDPNTPLEETFGELLKLVREGKIRHIGVSNFNKSLLAKALSIAPIVSNQVRYSLFERNVERRLLPFCKEKNVSILTWGSLGGVEKAPYVPFGKMRRRFVFPGKYPAA